MKLNYVVIDKKINLPINFTIKESVNGMYFIDVSFIQDLPYITTFVEKFWKLFDEYLHNNNFDHNFESEKDIALEIIKEMAGNDVETIETIERPYKILVTETLARIIEVNASDLSEAYEKVETMYDKSEIVLDYNDFVNVDFSGIKE